MGIPKGGIGFFDSGIGGLTVMETCRKLFPNEVFYYYGDNRHAPYGNLPVSKIKKYVFRAFKRFRALRVRAAVVACNTATAVCVEALRKKFSFPIIGAEPAVFEAARKGGEVFVLTTRATFESARFKNLCSRAETFFPQAKLVLRPCDGLAGEIERRILEKDADFTRLLPSGSPDMVVLGCTHYIYIAEQIGAFYDCPVVDGNRGIADRLRSVLRERSAESISIKPQATTFRPKNGQSDHSRPRNGRSDHIKSKFKKENANKCLYRKGEKSVKTPLKEGGEQLFFLGNAKKHNKYIHKQMFVRCFCGRKASNVVIWG